MRTSATRFSADALVIGAGAAGLITALSAAESGVSVIVVAQQPLGEGCNTAVSGGGFMMSTPDFSTEAHKQLTVQAGRRLNDTPLVDVLCSEANDARRWLSTKFKHSFNPKHNGQGYWFDGGGAGLFRKLSGRIKEEENIRLFEGVTVFELIQHNGRVHGAIGVGYDGQLIHFASQCTVLATGGYAGLYRRHDNPGNPVGEGVALALNAGAAVRDLEFVQFYPLGLAEPSLPTFMAFRPFPPLAKVTNAAGQSLIGTHLNTNDLNVAVGNHRDRLSQIVQQERQQGPVYLDLTQVDWREIDRWFSLKFLSQYDFPWHKQAAKIAPIAHHTMGGVTVNAQGATTVCGLYAVGEVASGVHGANRLGSNSLTECLVFGRRVGDHIAGRDDRSAVYQSTVTQSSQLVSDDLSELRALCWHAIGLTRNTKTMRAALNTLGHQPEALGFKGRCAHQLASAVVQFALRRSESRGSHARSDFAEEDPQQAQSLFAKRQAHSLQFIEKPYT